MQRVPVIDKDGKPLMPTTPQRARRWLESGKAVKRWSDLGVFYVQLTQPPSGTKTQPIVVGVDPGKMYSGIGVQSSLFTLFTAHLVLPFKRVKARLETRRTMRRARRSRRINRDVAFKLRNHRQKRFDNRRGNKLAPSIRANRQLEVRVVQELAAIFPISKIVWEYVRADVDRTSGREKARSGQGFSPVMVGQSYALKWLSDIAETVTLEGWETATLRRHLGLAKSRDKAAQTPQSHAVDGIALAASEFVEYEPFRSGRKHGKRWTGSVSVTASLFKVIQRPPICRRQLHVLQPAKGGKRRAYGGSPIRHHGLRKGDLVKAEMAGRHYVGYVSGDTQRQVSVSDFQWRRMGQFAAAKVQLIARTTGLLVSDSCSYPSLA